MDIKTTLGIFIIIFVSIIGVLNIGVDYYDMTDSYYIYNSTYSERLSNYMTNIIAGRCYGFINLIVIILALFVNKKLDNIAYFEVNIFLGLFFLFYISSIFAVINIFIFIFIIIIIISGAVIFKYSAIYR
jgi:hypothetical protein